MKFLLEDRKDWNVDFRPFAEVKHYSFEECDLSGYFAHGSFAFIEKCKGMGAKSYGNKEWFNWSNYARFIGDELLNSDYSIIPAIEMQRLKYQLLGRHAVDCKMFIRPDGGGKIFTGQIMDITEIDYMSSLVGSNLVVLSSPQEILGEWRFVIQKGGNILGTSLYRYQDNYVTASSCPPPMTDYVRRICKDIPKWPDDLMVLDVAQLKPGSFKIIECNSFSSSGLYAMKPEPIIEYIENLK